MSFFILTFFIDEKHKHFLFFRKIIYTHRKEGKEKTKTMENREVSKQPVMKQWFTSLLDIFTQPDDDGKKNDEIIHENDSDGTHAKTQIRRHRPTPLLADLSDIVESCQLEHGVKWTRSRTNHISIDVEVECPFWHFLTHLDTMRTGFMFVKEGAPIYRAVSTPYLKNVLMTPLRYTRDIPSTSADVVVMGTYMNKLNAMTECRLSAARHSYPMFVSLLPSENVIKKADESDKTIEEEKISSTVKGESFSTKENGKKEEFVSEMDASEDLRVYIPIRFGSHKDVARYIRGGGICKSHTTATMQEYEGFLLFKLLSFSENSFMNLLKKWLNGIGRAEFDFYEINRQMVSPDIYNKLKSADKEHIIDFDPLQSLRTFLDDRVFFLNYKRFSAHQQKKTGDIHIHPNMENLVYCGTSESEKEKESASYQHVPMIEAIRMVQQEYENRQHTLILTHSILDRYVACIDDVVAEYVRWKTNLDFDENGHSVPVDPSYRVPTSTMENLSNLRQTLCVHMPELFKAKE